MNGPRKIVVAGSGPDAFIAATALLRALAGQGLDVTVVATGAARDARVGRFTLPSQPNLHGLLGIPEPAFLTETGGTFKLATAHLGWQGEGSAWLHAHGEIGVEFAGTPFYKYLLSEARAGRAHDPENFSLAGLAARRGRFARPMGPPKSLTQGFTYGFHLDERAYTDYLRAHAARCGVRLAAPLSRVTLDENGAIASLALEDGTTLTGDLFIDASGAEAKLIGAVSTASRIDWSALLPCDSMWSGVATPVENVPAVTQTVAGDAGWFWRAPLARSTVAGYVFSSRFADDGRARDALLAFAPTINADPVLGRFSSGRRTSFWEKNCIAIGAAAVELEPLAGADLHLSQIGFATLMELFPRGADSAIEAAEYNRLLTDHADRLLDFTLAHYHAGAPRAGAFWQATRAATLPSTLTAKLDLFSASGRINVLDHETFEETDWAWLLIGAGRVPASIEIQMRTQIGKMAPRDIEKLRQHLEQLAASMPSHRDYLRLQSASPAPGAGR